MTAEQQQALTKLYLLRCDPTDSWRYEREACEILMDMRDAPYLKTHFSTSIKFSIGKGGGRKI